jgi:type I restriction enzyme S subunit
MPNSPLIPTLRFPGFEGEWEQKKLGLICKIDTGNRNTQDRKINGKYPFFVRSNTIEKINSFSYDGEAILTSGDGVGVGKTFTI